MENIHKNALGDLSAGIGCFLSLGCGRSVLCRGAIFTRLILPGFYGVH